MFINEIFADDAITKLSLFKSKSKKKQPLAKQNKKGVAEGFPHDVDHMSGKTIKHQDTNCATCHGRKSMYKLGGKLSADNKQGAEKVKCPTCKGTGDKPGVAEASNTMQRYGQLIIKRARQAKREAEAAEKAKRDAEQEKTEKEKKQGVEEGWKDVAIGGAMALGALGAGHTQAADLGGYNTLYLQQVVSGEHPRPMVSVNDAKQELQARMNGKQQTVSAPQADVPKGFSKEYLQKAADPNRFGRYLISVEKAQELLTGMQEGVAEGGMPSSVIKSKQRYGDMSDKDFAELHQSKADDDLVAMAWRHGYGKGSLHYVNKRKRGKEGVAEGLDEAVGGNYLYHATGPDINDLKNIIMNGLRTNTGNQERTGSKLRAVSFTRNWRYALTTKDDDNQGSTGINNGVIFVVDQSILKQKNKMQSVDRPADIINELKAILAALPTTTTVMDLMNLLKSSVSNKHLVALSQIAGTPLANWGSPAKLFISAVTKPYLADKTNQQALADAQSKIKQAISYFVKTSAGKSVASAGGSTGSEYEEVILTPLNYVPFRDLGVVGYMINPTVVDSAKQQEIRNLFAKAGVKEMPIPNSTTPGKNVTGATSPMIGTIRYQNRPTTDQQGVAEGLDEIDL